VPRPRRPAAFRGRVFRARDVLDAGLLTPSALRTSARRRLHRGIHADADLPDDHDLRISGACLLAPPAAVSSGRTAAWLYGARELADVGAPVEVSVPAGVRFGPVAGLLVRQVALPSSDVCAVGRRRCTSRARTALDLARGESLVEAVVALDVLLARDVVDRRELALALDTPASPRASAELGRRWHWPTDAPSHPRRPGCAPPRLGGTGRRPAAHGPRRRGWLRRPGGPRLPEHRLAVEYDGAWHGQAGQLARDRRRPNRLTATGWRVLFVTAADLRDPDALVARVAAALVR
jgi:hypothetical protein